MMAISKDAKLARIYCRVSTGKQGVNGLGIEAQIKTATAKAKELGLEVVEVCKEVESGRKTRLGRPILRKALADCEADGAVLIVAKMDRLTRNFAFLSKLADATERGGFGIIACDVPQLSNPAQTKFLWRLLAAVAELESETVRERTTKALAVAKEKGVKLGNPGIRKVQKAGTLAQVRETMEFARRTMPVIVEIQDAGIVSYRGIARALEARGVLTQQAELMDQGISRRDPLRGLPKWHPHTVKKVIERASTEKKRKKA